MQANLVSAPYRPSSPLTGAEGLAIYRGQNVKLQGFAPNLFYRTYQGNLNLNEPIPAGTVTGTLAFSPASTLVTGTGTNFLGELHIGDLVFANTEPLKVVEILSATQFRTGRPPTTTETTASATIAPIIFPLGNFRATMLHGNGAIFDKGTIIAVGNGPLRINGAVLPGDSLTGSRRAQVALYDSITNTYDVQDVGFDDTPTVANGDITVVGSGGTKNMSAGYYSFRFAYYSTITTGYGNPSHTNLSGGTAGYQVTAANSTINVDFSSDTPPSKADGYIIYGSPFNGSSANSQLASIQGPWYEVTRVPFTSLTAGEYAFDYVDAELDPINIVTFDNDPPSDAEYITTLDRYPVVVSTNGRGVNLTGRESETSPGPFLSPIKADNFDGYPSTYKVPTERGETIIGLVSAAGRFFVLTPNTLQAVTPTGLTTAPFTCRPFWRKGFQSPYNVCFVDDTLYGFTTAGMYRSIAQGDQGNESNVFASNVETQTADWYGAFEFTEYDDKNKEVCFIYSAAYQNENGWWVSEILPFNLQQQEFSPTIVLSDPDRDMIVSGTANVNGHLVFIAGGRRDGTTDQWDTFQYSTATDIDVPYYFVFNYQDNGVELIGKILRNFRPKGKFTSAKLKIYIVTPDSDIDIADLEAGTNPTVEIDLEDSSVVKQYKIFKRKIKNALMWTARFEGISNALLTGVDQFHELSLDVTVTGQER